MTPQQLTNRLNEAIAHHNAGRWDRAEAIYRQVAPLAPKMSLVYQLWGRAAEQQGKNREAIQLYQQALRLDPSEPTCAMRLAGIHIGMGRVGDAEALFVKLTQKLPGSSHAWTGMAFVLKIRGRFQDAIACHQKAVELDPKNAAAWAHYGLTLGAFGNNYQALEKYNRALAIDPENALALFGRAQSLHKSYRTEESLRDYEAVLKAQPQHHEARSYRLFALQNMDTVSREQLFEEHCAYGKGVGRGPNTLPGYDYSPEKKLRVGVLSPDLRLHSCAFFLEPLLKHLDSAEFEVFLYHDHFYEDHVSVQLRKLAKVWRNFVGQSNLAVEAAIRADKLDIVIDLAAHVATTVRLPMFARRVAPVQITYLGYPDTTGVPAMDYRFTDVIADPIGDADAFATEKLVRFAPSAWAYMPPEYAPAVSPLPIASGGPVTFGCFNSPTKFTDSLYRAWAALLKELPDARLLLKGRDLQEAPVREHVMSRMASQGVPIDHVDLLPRTADTAGHLAQYARMDIALDSFPYTGTTTTCEALWMGRPVVTLRGDRHASRVGASLLTCIGHPELVGQNPDDYVRLAIELARNRERAIGISAGLRDAMKRSPLLDHVGQSKAFAQALRDCWRERCNRSR